MTGGSSSSSHDGSGWMQVKNNTIPWQDEGDFNFTSNWTSPLSPPEESEKTIEGVVMAAIVIGIVATMLLLFSLAIFLDCRNQKLEAVNGKAKSWRPSRKKSRIPVFIANSAANKDAIAFANELCVENRETTAPTLAAHAQATVADC